MLSSVLGVLIFLVSTTSISNAIDKKSKSNVSFGFKTGLNISNPTHDDSFSDLENITKLSYGGFVSKPLSAKVTLQPEIQYITKGYKFSFSPAGSFVSEVNISYVEIPVLIKYNFPSSSATQVNLFIGPSLSFQLEAKANWHDIESSGVEQIDSLFNTTDIGLVVGGGFDFPISSGELTFDFRYTKGLGDIVKYGELKNSDLAIHLGYRFRLQ